jgi:hypothetical protein
VVGALHTQLLLLLLLLPLPLHLTRLWRVASVHRQLWSVQVPGRRLLSSEFVGADWCASVAAMQCKLAG